MAHSKPKDPVVFAAAWQRVLPHLYTLEGKLSDVLRQHGVTIDGPLALDFVLVHRETPTSGVRVHYRHALSNRQRLEACRDLDRVAEAYLQTHKRDFLDCFEAILKSEGNHIVSLLISLGAVYLRGLIAEDEAENAVLYPTKAM